MGVGVRAFGVVVASIRGREAAAATTATGSCANWAGLGEFAAATAAQCPREALHASSRPQRAQMDTAVVPEVDRASRRRDLGKPLRWGGYGLNALAWPT